LIGAIQDITQQKKVDQLIEYQANYDSLTGLPNRGLFQDRLHTALLHAQRRSTRIAVLFVDLDNFKSVNDNLGHDAGDELLVESAQRIQSSIRSVDTVARYSGDEFVALLVDVLAASVVSRIADDIVATMRHPFVLAGRQVYCSVSICVAFYPEDGESVDTLVIKADQAMYEVKKAGRNSWQFYTTAMQLESEQKHHLYNELVMALDQGLLTVFYQPIVDAASGRVTSCEALVRWPLEEGGWIGPDIFIPVAEERGLINRIDLFVLQSSLRFLNELNASLETPVALSVNVSPRVLHLRDDDAQEWLRTLERERQVQVTIEITERVLVEDSNSTHKVLDQLHQAGVQIAIDDFGTGYSGLSYFSRFPVSSVKIDRSFVQDLGVKSTETTLVETILLLASKLDIKVVAEGVETDKQAEFLRTNHCDYLQGYYISRPLPEQDFRDFVASQG
jgi:diguanylate cyclase (GGDEF)-like protein